MHFFPLATYYLINMGYENLMSDRPQLRLIGISGVMAVALKALYHAIRADCLLIEAARAHAANEQWAWWRIDKFACTFKPVR